MAYREIADSEVDPNAPVTAALLSALRDNPAAIANDEAGAPDVETSALSEPPLGFNSRWQDVSGSRVIDTSYENTSGQAIQVLVRGSFTDGSGELQVSHNGTTWVQMTETNDIDVSFVLPKDHFYRINENGGLVTFSTDQWLELKPL